MSVPPGMLRGEGKFSKLDAKRDSVDRDFLRGLRKVSSPMPKKLPSADRELLKERGVMPNAKGTHSGALPKGKPGGRYHSG